MSVEAGTTGNGDESADDELRLGRDQSYSLNPAPREPDDEVIRDYLDRRLDPGDESEVQILASTYREWAEAISRIVRERSESKKNDQ